MKKNLISRQTIVTRAAALAAVALLGTQIAACPPYRISAGALNS